MPIPTQTEMFGIVLGIMADGKERSRRDIKNIALDCLDITDEEATEKTNSGVSVYESRVGWSISYLSQAMLISRVKRGVYVINEEGRSALQRKMDSHTFLKFLRSRIAEMNPWNCSDDTQSVGDESMQREDLTKTLSTSDDSSPEEQIGALSDELNGALAEEIISRIMDRDPSFFERVVVDLLEKMGYGKGRVTKRTGDGGIDGLVTTDVLGFRPICTQAKRYAADHKIGRPTIQEFVGALNGAPNGVFITTSSFTNEAIEYAKGYPGATLSLIDGKRLAELMIEYNLGVATERVVEIKRIDTDYFEE